MLKTVDMAKIISKVNINPPVKKNALFQTLTTLTEWNREAIFYNINTLNSIVSREKKNYKIELSFEKDYIKVICIDPVLYKNDSSQGILDVEFKFYLHRRKVEFIIVLDRSNNEYTTVFQMNYNKKDVQFSKIIHPLTECSTEKKSRLIKKLKIRYSQGNATHGVTNDEIWHRSIQHHFRINREKYHLMQLCNQVQNTFSIDEYLIHKSLLTLTTDGRYEHFYLLIENLRNIQSGKDVHDIDGNIKPDYFVLKE